MRQLGVEVMEAGPLGVDGHAARTVVDKILADVSSETAEQTQGDAVE